MDNPSYNVAVMWFLNDIVDSKNDKLQNRLIFAERFI